MNIYISKGFDGEISKSKPTLTCGTSLYAILKKEKLNVKNIGNQFSQF